MFVRVAIATGSATVLAIPQTAVHRQNDQAFVLVDHGNGQYVRQPVRLGVDFRPV